MTLSEKEFRADRLNVKHLKLDGVDISNFYIDTLGDGKYIDSLRGDIQVNITPSMLNANGEYVIEQLPGLGRFKKVEVSMVSKPVYYLAPNGLDTNLGTKTSPWQTLVNVPDNSIVVLLNGTYTSSTRITALLGYSWTVQKCFYTDRPKLNLVIVGESKNGVIIQYNSGINRLLIPTGANVLNNLTVMNFTIMFSDITSSSSPYIVTEDRYMANICNVHFAYYNCTTNIPYNYYGSDSTKRYNLSTYSNNSYSTYFTTNIIDSRYNYLYSIDSMLSNLTINNDSIFSISEKTTDNVKQSKTVDLMSNIMTFKTDILNFNTITLNLWLEQ